MEVKWDKWSVLRFGTDDEMQIMARDVSRGASIVAEIPPIGTGRYSRRAWSHLTHEQRDEIADYIVAACNERAALVAENARLREALEGLADEVMEWRKTGSPRLASMTLAHDAAAAALGGRA